MSTEQQQERKPSVEAEAIRKDAEALSNVLLGELGKAGNSPIPIAKTMVAVHIRILDRLSEIAAQLAEINSRDSAAEIRARDAEAFVLGMQAELQRLQNSGIVIPGMSFGPGKQGG